jgi:hypothetical protein
MPVSGAADKKADKPADGCDSHHILAHSVSCAKIFVCFLEPKQTHCCIFFALHRGAAPQGFYFARV